MEENNRIGTQQQGSTGINPIVRVANCTEVDFFYVDEYIKNKAARTEKEHAKSFELMSQKFKKLQATLKKQAGELGFNNMRILILRLREGIAREI